jgi:hypothetical protein
MFKKLLLIIIVFISSISMFSQNSVNDYKYVIVPNRFDFLDEDDQYQLNSISHFLFNKYGFIAIKEDDIFPEDLMFNPCLALKNELIDDSGAFKTKLKIELKNCNGEVIFTSEYGESFDKKYAVAYNKALREAFIYVNALNYNYKPNEQILALGKPSNKNTEQEIEQLKEEIATLKQEKEVQVAVKEATAVNADKVVEKTEEKVEISLNGTTTLYAQKTDYGFQVVDSTPKVVMVLLNTKNPEVFMVKGKNAMVIKEDGFWYLSENDGEQVKNTLIEIKF